VLLLAFPNLAFLLPFFLLCTHFSLVFKPLFVQCSTVCFGSQKYSFFLAPLFLTEDVAEGNDIVLFIIFRKMNATFG